nr:immunoglobulin light chain junction region [Macaca mulatta]MOX82383.1 immunoglobulin light chain junction region [Macaca mulatta]
DYYCYSCRNGNTWIF